MRNGLIQHREDLFTDDSQTETLIGGVSNPFSSTPTTYTLSVYVGLSDRNGQLLRLSLQNFVLNHFLHNNTVNIISAGIVDGRDELGYREQAAHWLITTTKPLKVIEGLKRLCVATNQRAFGLVGFKHDQTIWEV